MKVHKNEILIYYNPESSSDKKTVAYARSISNHVAAYPFNNGPTKGRIWRNLLDMLGLHPKEMMNKANPYYQNHIRGREFDDESWLKVLIQNTHLIKAPIAIKGNQAILCTNPTDVYKLQRQAAY